MDSIQSSWSEWKGGDSWGYRLRPRPRKASTMERRPTGYEGRLLLRFTTEEKYMMELADVRNALENTATKLADFRGSL